MERLKRSYRVHGVILFGSRARGDHLPRSDVDLLIIGDFREPYLERLKNLLELAEGISEPVEPHPYNLEEALKLLEAGNPTIVDALEEGLTIYEEKSLNILRKNYAKLRSIGKLRRSDYTISI